MGKEGLDVERKYGKELWKELKNCGLTWETVNGKVVERQQWKYLVEALCVKWDMKRIQI
uniref:Uncharacterized protein n=1 Tax=Arion vulgaris TaxID=1028688 RepID=A0A0B7B4B3_9EUPU